MGTAILWVVAAFLLYMVVLPLAGVLLAFVLRIAFPYLGGGAIVLWLLAREGLTGTEIAWWVVAGMIWLWAMSMSRNQLRQSAFCRYSWDEGHYRSMVNALLGGFPLRWLRRRSLKLRCLSIYPGRLVP